MQTEIWRTHAACKDKPTYMFFEGYEEDKHIQLEVDKLCAGCPVKRECVEYAIATQVEGGVFGRKYFDFKKVRK